MERRTGFTRLFHFVLQLIPHRARTGTTRVCFPKADFLVGSVHFFFEAGPWFLTGDQNEHPPPCFPPSNCHGTSGRVPERSNSSWRGPPSGAMLGGERVVCFRGKPSRNTEATWGVQKETSHPSAGLLRAPRVPELRGCLH